MTALPQSPLVSRRIAEPLALVARRQWNVVATRGVVLTLLVALAILLVGLLVLGFLPALPAWGRVTAAVAVWGAVLAAGVRFLRPAMRRATLVRTAMDVERRLARAGGRDTHERIASAVELGQEADPRFAGSPELVRQLVAEAEADAAVIKAEVLVPAKPVATLALLLIPVVAAWVVLAISLPPSRFVRPLFNLLLPWREPPATLSDLVVTPGDVSVARGDPVSIEVAVNPRSLAGGSAEVPKATIAVRHDKETAWTDLPMSRLGPRAFRYTTTADQSFKYRVTAGPGESAEYAVTVQPVPAIASLAVQYVYPPYTKFPPRTDATGNGAIDGIRGTRVTVVVRPAEPIAAASRLALSLAAAPQGAPSTPELPLVQTPDGSYAASFVLESAGSYRVRLANEIGRLNRDKGKDRPIVVRADEPPKVALLSPTKETIVRPDDAVPLSYEASDDLGLAKVELLAQVDGGLTITVPLKLPVAAAKKVAAGYSLAVADLLAKVGSAGGKPPAAGSISYWLKATDGRDPDPQSAESERQTLRVDAGAEPLAARLARERAADFAEAIRKAIGRLDEVRDPVARFQHMGRDRETLEIDDRDRLNEIKAKLETAGNDLSDAADHQADGPFALTASRAKAIAETRIFGAANAVARIDLQGDQPELRKAAADVGHDQIVKGRRELDDLLKRAEERAKLLDAQRKLETLAKQQDAAAKAMAKAPADQPPQPDPEQPRINQQTREAIEQAKLTDKEAQKQAQALQELIDKVAELRKRQQEASEQTRKQAELDRATDAAKQTAEKQADLNKRADAFAKAEQKPLERASAPPPDKAQLNNIVSDLKSDRLQQAADQQRSAAERFEQAMRQLQEQSRTGSPRLAGERQRDVDQAKADADAAARKADEARNQVNQARDAAQRADQAGQQADAAAKGKNADEQANAARQAADASDRAAQQAKAAGNAADLIAKKADAAAKAADDAAAKAKDAAAQAKKDQDAAAKDLKAAEAAIQEQSRKDQAAGTPPDADAAKKREAARATAQKAAEVARHDAETADRSADIAKRTAESAKRAAADVTEAKGAADDAQKAADAAKASAQAVQKARDAKDEPARQKAAADAGEQAKRAGQKSAEAAQKTADAAAKLTEAQRASAEQVAAKANAEAQESARLAADKAETLGKEQRALSDEVAAQARAMAEAQQRGALPNAQAAAKQAEVAQSVDRAAVKAKSLGKIADQNTDPQIAARADAAGKALEQAKTDQRRAAAAQRQGQTGQAADAQKAAQEQLARAEQSLRGLQQPGASKDEAEADPKGDTAKAEKANAKDAKPSDDAGQKSADADGGKPGDAQAKAGGPKPAATVEQQPGETDPSVDGGQAQQAPADSPTAEQAMKQAARTAAEAVNAQQQAAQGNAGAAKQAADALAKAAKALAQAAGKQGQPGQGQPAQAQGNKPGQEPGDGDQPQPASPTAGQSGDPKQGIAAKADGGSTEVPASVVDLGVTPSDWAKLAPQQQKELITAAQQSGPPEYQAMVKNYYVRIARMQARSGGAEK